MSRKVNILILNWNGSKYLVDLIQSIKAIDYNNYKITLIDNNSTDDSLLKIKNEKINIVSHKSNYMFAKGYNKAIIDLKNDDSDFFLLLNNDTICDKNILDAFSEALDKYGDDCIMGPKILYMNDKKKIWYAGGNFGLFNFFVSHRGIRKKDEKPFNKDCLTDYITGCCLFISKKNYLKLNGFDEKFNMYGEDVDLSIRAQNLGIKCYYISNARLWHYVSASYGGNFNLVKIITKISSLFKLMIKYPKRIILGLK